MGSTAVGGYIWPPYGPYAWIQNNGPAVVSSLNTHPLLAILVKHHHLARRLQQYDCEPSVPGSNLTWHLHLLCAMVERLLRTQWNLSSVFPDRQFYID